MEGRSGRATGSEEGRALRGARQGVGQNSVNKVEGRTDRVTPEQSSVEGRAELRARADNSFFYIHSFFVYFVLHETCFSFGTQKSKIRQGCAPVDGGCVPKWDAVNMQKYPLLRTSGIPKAVVNGTFSDNGAPKASRGP